MQAFLLTAPALWLCFTFPLFCLDSDFFFLITFYMTVFPYLYAGKAFFPHTDQLPIVTPVTTRNETLPLSHRITADPRCTFSHPKSFLQHSKKNAYDIVWQFGKYMYVRITF